MVHAICTNKMYPQKRVWQYDLPIRDEALIHSVNQMLTRNVKEVFSDERFNGLRI